MKSIRVFTGEELKAICESTLGHLEEVIEALVKDELPLSDDEQFAAFHAVLDMCQDMITAKYIDDCESDAENIDDEFDFPTYLS